MKIVFHKFRKIISQISSFVKRGRKGIYYFIQALIVIAVVATIVYAQNTWVNPSAEPPGGNIAAPLNTGSTAQTKTGDLTIMGKVGIGTTTSPGAKLHIAANAPSRDITPLILENLAGASNIRTTKIVFRGNVENGSRDVGSIQLNVYDVRPGSFFGSQKTVSDLYFNLREEKNDDLIPIMVIKGNSGNVGIGTTNPGAKLEVAGQIKITGGNPGVGKVLTSDAEGLASWQTAPGTPFLARANGKGVWKWQEVYHRCFSGETLFSTDQCASFDRGSGLHISETQEIPLSTTRAVLGIAMAGGSDDGGYCVAWVPSYFIGAIGRYTTWQNLDPNGSFVVSVGNRDAGPMSSAQRIFEALNPGGFLTPDSPYNKPAGLIYIPPGKVLKVKQAYNNKGGGGPGYVRCQVQVLYGDPLQ